MKIINVFTNKTDVSEKLSVTLKEILEKKNFSVSYSYNPNAILNICNLFHALIILMEKMKKIIR